MRSYTVKENRIGLERLKLLLVLLSQMIQENMQYFKNTAHRFKRLPKKSHLHFGKVKYMLLRLKIQPSFQVYFKSFKSINTAYFQELVLPLAAQVYKRAETHPPPSARKLYLIKIVLICREGEGNPGLKSRFLICWVKIFIAVSA